MKCNGTSVPSMKPCKNEPVTTRKNWRFKVGPLKDGESIIEKVTLYFCQGCADAYDENQAEARAEAAGS